eukprot:CAMPEP_0170617894 /NCGR_PEP_ID=MMETSP0224-20130122/26667_1 /TAXON_ID=285029 /ORGANISM="Togula jolla, Strain CCCM 725" /LENGTH=552 /DNA_ID=CAMNT_0010943829 /DNA_START=56 /DNA_END=1715 /DNA_ORIENTATION=+
MAREEPVDELAEIQAELQMVKKALRNGTGYLGMKGETLQRYLLQLNEKENLHLSHKLRNLSGEAPASMRGQALEPFLPSQSAPQQPQSPAVGTNGRGISEGSHGEAALASGDAPSEGPGGTGGSPATGPNSSDARRLQLQHRDPPSGAAPAFNRESLEEVHAHLCAWEAVPVETAKALRALSALAYADALKVGSDESILTQVLRVLDIHENEDHVQLAGMRTICNMAYSAPIALGKLASNQILSALLAAAVRTSNVKEIGAKASEAIARIIAAEVAPEEAPEGAAPPAPAVVIDGPGALCGLFSAATGGEASWQGLAAQLVVQLVSNEVVGPLLVARRFTDAATVSTTRASGWLTLAKQLVLCDCPDLPLALIDAGAIAASAEMMRDSLVDGPAQLAGIEAMSALVGNRWSGLQAFAEAKGMERIEGAMKEHLSDGVLQTKGIRALASGVQWPEDVQQKSSYSFKRSVDLTKTAMSQHVNNTELQTAGLEALAKYLDKMHCIEEVKSSGGEGLVKAMMTRHPGVTKVQTWGKIVLDGIGVDRHWAPRGGTTS